MNSKKLLRTNEEKAMEKLMDIFTQAAQALSDKTRLRILNVLTAHECCVCEVMQALDISQTRASRNLKILNDAGFLQMRTDGLYTLYSISNANPTDFHANLLKAVSVAIKENQEAIRDIERLQQSKRVWSICTRLNVNTNFKTAQSHLRRSLV